MTKSHGIGSSGQQAARLCEDADAWIFRSERTSTDVSSDIDMIRWCQHVWNSASVFAAVSTSLCYVLNSFYTYEVAWYIHLYTDKKYATKISHQNGKRKIIDSNVPWSRIPLAICRTPMLKSSNVHGVLIPLIHYRTVHFWIPGFSRTIPSLMGWALLSGKPNVKRSLTGNSEIEAELPRVDMGGCKFPWKFENRLKSWRSSKGFRYVRWKDFWEKKYDLPRFPRIKHVISWSFKPKILDLGTDILGYFG